MSILEKTFPASFKGVSFLVDSASTAGGIMNAKHVFPNSSRQTIETLGTKQKVYNIAGFIANDPEEDDYLDKKNALIEELDSGIKGVLIHPLFGTVNNIKCTEYKVHETFTALGRADFSITFEVDLSPSVPQVESNTESQVLSALDDVSKSAIADIDSNFLTEFFNNIQAAIELVQAFVAKVKAAIAPFIIAAEKLNELSNEISDLANSVVDLIRTPLKLAEAIENIISTVRGAMATIEASFDALVEMFDFGDDSVSSQQIPTTASLLERRKNELVLNQAIQALALSNAYQVASEISFESIEDQNEASEILEARYLILSETATVLDLSGINVQIGISNDTKSALSGQRIAVEKLFEDNRVILGRIISVKTVQTSSRLLAYQYYGDSLLSESIVSLNSIRDSSFIEGEVRVITQ